MHQLPPEVWNQIARETTLASPAARAAFNLPAEKQEQLLENWAKAETQAKTPSWAVIPLQEVMPLMLEAQALSQFKAKHPEFLPALPEVNSPEEAAALMSRERQWSPAQRSTFLQLLQSGQPATRWQQSAKALHASSN